MAMNLFDFRRLTMGPKSLQLLSIANRSAYAPIAQCREQVLRFIRTDKDG